MSLLINGIEMPTDRPLWIIVHSDGTVEANEVSASRPVGWQTLRNAAVPVPPHGDLIDRNELGVMSWKEDEVEDSFDAGVLFVLDHADELPIIIPAEEGE